MPGYAVSLVAGSLLAFASAAAADDDFSITRLGDDVFAIMRNDPPGFAVESNSGFIECRDQIVVVDTQSNEATTRRVLDAIRKHSAKPVRYVINTHWHDDHIVGNRIYREAFPGVRFIAHQQSLTYLPGDGKKNRDKFHRAIPDALAGLRTTLQSGKTSAGQPLTDEQRASLASDIRLAEGYLTVPDDFAPVLADVPVSEKFEIRAPGCKIDVLPLGNAHTTGDLVVHVVDARVVFVGDMIGWPVPLVGADQSRVREWSATLNRVRELDAKVIVPGHGPVMRDYTQLDRISTLMTAITQRVDEARARGETLEAARSRIDLGYLRRQFAGDSPVHATLFDAYVAGPAVTNAWNIIPATDASGAIACDSKERSRVQVMICSNAQLVALDVRAAHLFSIAISENPAAESLRRQQGAWLAQRDACRTNKCIERAYHDRISDLERYTGDFSREYLDRLCDGLEDPADRKRMLSAQEGVDDINNDGTPERMESCWGGISNEPCGRYLNGDQELIIDQSEIEMRDYATFSARSFRYDGKTFSLHGRDNAEDQPVYLSYVKPTNTEIMLCEFDNRIVNVLKRGDPEMCEALQQARPVELGEIGSPPRAFERRETTIEARGELDIDNDGQAEQVAKLVYASGAGRGCAYTYFELTAPDGSLRRDATSALLNDLQELPEDGFEAKNCGATENRLLQHQGKLYLESNSTNNPLWPHQIRVIEQGRVQDVCTFEARVETRNTATRQ